jgi:hypothetical protein
VAVEPFHLDRYIAEQVFRFNDRTTKDNPLTDGGRFALAISLISGKLWTFAALAGKVPPVAKNGALRERTCISYGEKLSRARSVRAVAVIRASKQKAPKIKPP